MVSRSNAWLVTGVAVVACGAAFALTAAVPLGLPLQQALDIAAIPKMPTTVPADDSVSLAGLDVNLRRPLADQIAADPAVAPAGCVLLGTSIDPARPMAFLQLPDGTSRWLALNETTSGRI